MLNTNAGEENVFKLNLSISYIGKQSVKFRKKISALLNAKFDIDINIVYTTTKVGSYFNLKSRTPLPLVSSVVYEFVCLNDQTASYVGMTDRNVTLIKGK